MKRKAWIVAAIIGIVFSATAYAEGLSDHHRTLLNILASMSAAEVDGMYEEAYYNEVLNAFVLTYRQDDPVEELIERDPSFAKDLAKNCALHMCDYYMDWIDMFNIDVDIIIRHIAEDGDFLFCMKNGIMTEKDIALEGYGASRSEDEKAIIKLYLKLMETAFDGQNELIFGCEYEEEKDEILMVYTSLTTTGYDLEREKGKTFKKQLDKEIKESIYDPIKEQIEEANIHNVSLRIKFVTPDAKTITEIYNGEIIK